MLPLPHTHVLGQHGMEEGALESEQPEIALFPRTEFGKIFFVKSHIINVLGSVKHKISFTSIQLYSYVK